jgi:hypothetical protein
MANLPTKKGDLTAVIHIDGGGVAIAQATEKHFLG